MAARRLPNITTEEEFESLHKKLNAFIINDVPKGAGVHTHYILSTQKVGQTKTYDFVPNVPGNTQLNRYHTTDQTRTSVVEISKYEEADRDHSIDRRSANQFQSLLADLIIGSTSSRTALQTLWLLFDYQVNLGPTWPKAAESFKLLEGAKYFVRAGVPDEALASKIIALSRWRLRHKSDPLLEDKEHFHSEDYEPKPLSYWAFLTVDEFEIQSLSPAPDEIEEQERLAASKEQSRAAHKEFKANKDNVASNWQNMVDERLLDWYESGTSLEHAVSTLTHADVRDDLRARALENTWSHSDHDSSDPYLKIFLSRGQLENNEPVTKTKAISNCLEPVWKRDAFEKVAHFTLPVGKRRLQSYTCLIFQVWNENTLVDSFLGEANFDLQGLSTLLTARKTPGLPKVPEKFTITEILSPVRTTTTKTSKGLSVEFEDKHKRVANAIDRVLEITFELREM